jgi:hypothetical protein
MPDTGATSAKTPEITPEMQAAIDQAAATKRPPYVDTPPSAAEAGIMGQAGSDIGGVTYDMLEKTGHVKPSDLPSSETGAPTQGMKATPPTPVATPTKSIGPVVGAAAPSVAAAPAVKDIVSNIVADHAKTSPPGESWQDFLKGAVGKVGEFLQRWGLNEQGAPGVQTHGEVKQAQQFELEKAGKQAQIQQNAMAMENQYQTARMQLQQQMNQANMTAQGKIEIQNRLTEMEQAHKNQLSILPLELQQQFAMRQWQPGADPSAHILDQGK